MPCTVSFHPLQRAIDVAPGTTVLQAARAAGVPLGAACDGDGICGACAVRVLDGRAGREGALERRTKLANGVAADLRLACLIPARGDLRVTTAYW
jgi:2Fe-2S ferredoxin